MVGIASPAFAGATFDSSGSCLYHPEVKLTQKTTVDGGKVVYKELRRRCPKCTSSSHKSKTSSPDIKRHESYQSGGSNRRDRRGGASNGVGGNNPSSPNPSYGGRSSSRSRARSRSPSRGRSKSPSRHASSSDQRPRSRARSSSRARDGGGGGGSKSLSKPKSKKKFDTPFDPKGRCHHHSGVQLAKKKLTGGWKLILPTCPKCLEDQYNNENADNRSVSSRRSHKSSRSVQSRGERDKSSNRKKGFSMKKNSPRIECPFNNQGYCHRHSNVRLAKKKLTGGWKILQDVCVICLEEDKDQDDNRSTCSRNSRRSMKSAVSRSSRRSASSRRSHRHEVDEDETDSEVSTSQSEQIQQKKFVKKMNYTDDYDEEGVYTGYVNSQCKPHGSGKLVYNNGKKFSGEWCEGSKVHGKTSHEKPKKNDRKETRDRGRESSSKSGRSKNGSSASGTKGKDLNEKQKQDALRQYKELYNSAKVVKNMLFVDAFGDRGRYSGEVNERKMPHGNGEITYDHGLVQEGKWTNGVLDEDGSIISGRTKNSQRVRGMAGDEKSFRRRARSKDP